MVLITWLALVPLRFPEALWMALWSRPRKGWREAELHWHVWHVRVHPPLLFWWLLLFFKFCYMTFVCAFPSFWKFLFPWLLFSLCRPLSFHVPPSCSLPITLPCQMALFIGRYGVLQCEAAWSPCTRLFLLEVRLKKPNTKSAVLFHESPGKRDSQLRDWPGPCREHFLSF